MLIFRLLGNDLARVLRWGSGYAGEDPYHILLSVDEADEVLMDRWTILLDAQDFSGDGKDKEFLEPPKVRPGSWSRAGLGSSPSHEPLVSSQIVQMNNYFGLGIDAELSLDFHLAREDEPDKFTSRWRRGGLGGAMAGRVLSPALLLQVPQQRCVREGGSAEAQPGAEPAQGAAAAGGQPGRPPAPHRGPDLPQHPQVSALFSSSPPGGALSLTLCCLQLGVGGRPLGVRGRRTLQETQNR